MKLDRSMLPEGVSFERKEGLYAKLGPQGQVLHLGIYVNGTLKPETWSLDVAPDGSWARAQQSRVVQWPPEKHEDADEDEETPSLASFAREWFETISQGVKVRPLAIICSFCGKAQNEVKKIVAGPSVYICDECVRLCNDIISGEGSSGE